MTLEEKIKQIIEEELHVKIRHNGETMFDLGADELDLENLADVFSDKFGIGFVLIGSEFTVREVVRIVRRELANSREA